MKIIVVGASGWIGSKVIELLDPKHEVVRVGISKGDITMDFTDAESIRAMYSQVGKFDALVATAGGGSWLGPFEEAGDGEFQIGLNGKLMGQINLVLIGHEYINDNGVFTLTSGRFAHSPIPKSVVAGTVCAAVDGFILQASVSLPRGIRINSVSPAKVVDEPTSKGSGMVTRDETASAYLESIEGAFPGRTLRVWNAPY